MFPSSVTSLLKTTVSDVDWGPSVTAMEAFGRPLRPTDPDASVGIYALNWEPGEFEIGQVPPAFSRYHWQVQLLIKHAVEEEGHELHSSLSKKLRAVLYNSEALRVALGQLSESSDGFLERVQRWGCANQRFFANDLRGHFLFLSSIDFWVEVETIKE